jgi:twinkle protein
MTTNEGPVAFLERNGIAHEVKGREVETTCPVCRKERHCRVNSATWLWHCKRCDARGNESSLKVALGLQFEVSTATKTSLDRVEERSLEAALRSARPRSEVERWTFDLVSHPDAALARDYLRGRGFPLEVCERYRLGWCANADGSTPRSARRRVSPVETEPSGPGWLVIPSFLRSVDGRPDPASAAVVKLRSVPPSDRAFRRLVGGESVLFAPNGVDATSTLLVVGGELDALSCVVAGWSNVVSSTVGEPNWKPETTALLDSCEDIVVVYDNDEAGRKGAARLVETLGSHRCRLGAWPVGTKDANEALQKFGSGFDLTAIVDESKSLGTESIVKVSDIRDEYVQELRGGKPRGVSSGWTDLDALVGGIRFGEVTLVTGDTASGKSTFCSNFALNMARAGHRVLFCPFELGPKRQLAKFVRQFSQTAPDLLSDSELDSTLDSLDGLPLFLLRRYGAIKLEAMRNTLLHCIRRLGVRFVVLDHLHFMVSEGPEERTDLDAMMKMFAEVAVDLRVHIVVVAHPRQAHSSNETHKDNRIIQASDLKGSAGLKQLSDNIWSVWRPRRADRSDSKRDANSSVAVLYVLKNRDDFGSEGSVAFRFGLQSATFETTVEEDSTPAPPKTIAEILPQTDQGPRPRRLRKVSTDAPPPTRHWAETEKETE